MNTKLNIVLCLSLTLAVLAPLRAQSRIFLEPYFGYENGSFTQENKDDAKGLNYGIRLGYGPQRIALGYELSLSHLEVEAEPGTISDYKIKDQGVFLLYRLQFGNLWGSYIFQSESRERVGDLLEGKAYRLGFGLRVFGKANLNVEKLTREYNKLNQSQLDSTFKVETFILSLGVPIP